MQNPPGGYRYPPQQGPPPGWPPPPVRPVTTSQTTAILLAPLTLVALVVVLFSGHAADQCNSGIGQLAQGFSTRAFHDCTTANLVHIISIVVLVVAGVGCAAAFITHIAGGHRPPPYPTWPPMQDMPPAPPPRVGPGVAPQRPPWSPPPAS